MKRDATAHDGALELDVIDVHALEHVTGGWTGWEGDAAFIAGSLVGVTGYFVDAHMKRKLGTAGAGATSVGKAAVRVR